MNRFRDLKDRILAFINSEAGDDRDFEKLALELYSYQLDENDFYRRFCELTRPAPVLNWADIPAFPASAFKAAEIRSFPAEQTITFFQTSGTTTGSSGRHYFADLALYDAAIVPNFKKHLMPDLDRIRMIILTPSPEEEPHSSLVHMMQIVSERFGSGETRFYLRGGNLDFEALKSTLMDASSNSAPVMLLGTAFAFVLAMDRMKQERLRFELPGGSRIMETGGFKGRSREVPRPELYSKMSECFGVAAHRIVNEYGMTELSSQFYDISMVEGRPVALKSYPHWTRVIPVDPLTGIKVPDGETGLLRIYDLANLGSVIALQTEDVGVMHGDHFEVLGRVAHAEPRGCSLNVEPLLDPIRQLSADV